MNKTSNTSVKPKKMTWKKPFNRIETNQPNKWITKVNIDSTGESSGGPNVRVGWYQSDGKALESRAKYQNDNVYFYHLELHRLSRDEHGKTFWCRATVDVHPAIEPIQSNITLNIRRIWLYSSLPFIVSNDRNELAELISDFLSMCLEDLP